MFIKIFEQWSRNSSFGRSYHRRIWKYIYHEHLCRSWKSWNRSEDLRGIKSFKIWPLRVCENVVLCSNRLNMYIALQSPSAIHVCSWQWYGDLPASAPSFPFIGRYPLPSTRHRTPAKVWTDALQRREWSPRSLRMMCSLGDSERPWICNLTEISTAQARDDVGLKRL